MQETVQCKHTHLIPIHEKYHLVYHMIYMLIK